MKNEQRQLILQSLQKLQPHRDMAWVFLRMLENNSLPETLLEDLSKSLHAGIVNAKSKREKALFTSAHETIKKIQEDEKKHIDEQEAEELLESI